jgi:hypothetical protein
VPNHQFFFLAKVILGIEMVAKEWSINIHNAAEELDPWFVDDSKCCIYKMIEMMQCSKVMTKGKPCSKTKKQ